MDIASLVSDPGTIVAWIVSVGIPAAAAAYLGYQNGGLKGAFNAVVNLGCSNVPQTADQTALITSGKVPDAFWKMPADTKDTLWTWLRAKGGEFTRPSLDAVVAQAESESQVEYAIIIVDHKGKVDETVDHAFVSYGTPVYGKYAEIHAKAEATTSKEYHLETRWIMLEDERKKLLSEIGPHPVCITKALEKIQEAEDDQTEKFYIVCSEPSMGWEITKGNITNRWGGTTEPASASVTVTPAAEVATPTT